MALSQENLPTQVFILNTSTMSYSSPLSKLPIKRRPQKDPPVAVPEKLVLPDGREFVLKDLLRARGPVVGYNLLSRRRAGELKPIVRARSTKYTIDDRIWQSRATVEEIQERYTIGPGTAKNIRYQAIHIVQQLARNGLIEDRQDVEE